MLNYSLDDRNALEALRQIASRLGSPAPVLSAIGETLTESTKHRFDTSTGPDGERWAPNTETTILQYLGAYKGSYTKSGRMSAKGSERVLAKKPLIGETRSLSSTITWQLDGKSVLIGSPMVQAAVQQFGAKAHEFGPAPWGDIPARPYLGVSISDERDIFNLLGDFLLPL